MSTEAWMERVRKAWREVEDASGRSEAEVADAGEHFWRALFNRPPIPPEVRDARVAFGRHLGDWTEDGDPYDPVQRSINEDLMRQVTDAECAAGIHAFCACRHRKRRRPEQQADEDPVTGDWFDARRAQVWGVIHPDGTVQAKGFVGDDTADDDKAVYPAGSIAYYSPDRGWTNAATGHPASRGPTRPVTPPKRPDLADLRRGRWYDTNPITPTTTGSGGAGMASIEEVRAGIMAANEQANQALGALQQARNDLEQALGMLQHATEGSVQADVSQTIGLFAKAVQDAEQAQQATGAGIAEAESVAGRL